MDPAQRDRYLAALGIVRYRPRPAPGTSTPPVAAVGAPVPKMPEAEVSDAEAPEPQVPEPQVPEVLEQSAARLRGSEATSPPRPAQPPAPPVPTTTAAAAGGAIDELLPPLRLACWRPAPDLLVFDAQPPGGRPSRDQLTLLGNILAAIGRRPATLPAAEFIDWPLVPGGDCSLTGAREALALFLRGRQSQSSFVWLLVLGEPAWRCFADAACAGQRLAVAEGAVQAILVPGLAEMLADPQSKAASWRAIRFLAPGRD